MATWVGCKERAYVHKIDEALKTTVTNTLYEMLMWAMPDKLLGESIFDYMMRLDKNSPANYHRVNATLRKFTKEQREIMLSDFTLRKADITLLFKLFKLFAHDVAAFDDDKWKSGGAHLESLITSIKNIRNVIAHESCTMNYTVFNEMANKLRVLLTEALKAAKEKYGRSDVELQKKTKEMEDGLYEVFQQVLGKEELLSYCHQDIKNNLITEANNDLQAASVFINPLHFLLESDVEVIVQQLFSKMLFRKKDQKGRDIILDSSQIVNVSKHDTYRPQLLLTEGEAGSGKSTLLTMITHEWLEGGHGQIKGLDKYHLILRVQCRDRHLNSLDDLLRNALPLVYCKNRNLMLPILKGCNILFLIDGQDEANPHSWKVVQDILNAFKDASSSTILLTSRPEAIPNFRSTIPTEYQVTGIKLLGIDKKDRQNFVTNYIILFQDHAGKTVDLNKLQQTIESICGRDHFNVPLNLVFLAWQCIHDPNSVSETESQTQLYFWAHKLIVQKLKERLLNKKPEFAIMDKMELTRRVKECMEALCQCMLQAVINKHVVFIDHELRHVITTCDRTGIPCQEVLSAFLTIKVIKAPLGEDHQYTTPHKGLQDYLAAVYVDSKLKQQPHSTIKEVIKGELGPIPMEVKDFTYIVLHLFGLLKHHLKPAPNRLHEEVVQLLHEAKIDSWGKVVELAEYNTEVITAITRLIPRGELMLVKDHVKGHSALLSHLMPTEVKVKIPGLVPDLSPLMGALTHHNVTSVDVLHNIWNPQPTTTLDPFLQALMSRDGLEIFSGQWHKSMTRLPSTLEYLGISVTEDEQVQTLMPALHSLTHLPYLDVHVRPTVTPAAITTNLPDTVARVNLYLVDLTEGEITRACQLVDKLKPKSKGYNVLEFYETRLPKEGWKLLLEGLIQLGVRVEALIVPRDPNTEDPELETLTREGLGSRLLR
ncbi:hypothetical protein Pcinc_004691 [Petrolisthes cinctipes]|uniref:NACHT domain-containing protein n=1 Tax=Petrolisthes cinctipes TaxID=88211 RepID=A0AAE1GGJ2_PETCI|nr:hypothetical protein Pcinc_004691 [Petrolisthes cinctipes]